MRLRFPLNSPASLRLAISGAAGLALGLLISACTGPGAGAGNPPNAATENASLELAAFEQPNPPVTWIPLQSPTPPADSAPANPAAPLPIAATQTTQPATTKAAALPQRSSLRPHAGLWSQAVTVGGEAPDASSGGTLLYSFPKPLNLGRYDLFTAHVMHTDAASRNGDWTATMVLTDVDGTAISGNPYPVMSRWQAVPLNLSASTVDMARVASIGILLRPGKSPAAGAPPQGELTIQTDSWTAQSTRRAYVGRQDGPPRSFYVEAQSTAIRVGAAGLFELHFSDGCTNPLIDISHRWLRISAGNDLPVGAPGTGLMLLDQENLETLGSLRRNDPDDVPLLIPPPAQAASERLPSVPWLGGGSSVWSWQVAWTSPIAALVEGRQECGPYDRLGEPRAALKWHFMIYQSGQVFVHVDWNKFDRALSDPVSWALVLDDSAGSHPAPADENAQRLLTDIYPATFRQGLLTALPHRMQTDAPLAMLGKPAGAAGAAKDIWWWAQGKLAPPDLSTPQHLETTRKMVGSGFSAPAAGNANAGRADCMLVVNNPNALSKAGMFGQYLVPPKIILRQGELDRTIPGDVDEDGFVESYGYQAIRLSGGRASFTIYPQGRPIFYPVFLFTIPAAERNSSDVRQSHVVINIDGKQFMDPPQFLDGSYLLQVPYVLDRPVSVEAKLERK